MTGLSHRFTKMGWSRSIAAVVVYGILGGCSGHVYSVPKPVLDPDKNRYEGVLAYPPAYFIEISWTTSVLEDKTNKVLRTSTGIGDNKCIPQVQTKQLVRGDYDSPYQIFYDPGFLGNTISKSSSSRGVLKSVGVDSTPDRGETFKNMATAAGEAAKAFVAVAEADVACTHEPVLKFIKKSADVCPGGKCDFKDYSPPP